MEHVLFFLFAPAKLILLPAIGRWVGAAARNRLSGICIVVTLALSEVLNGATPIAGTTILVTTSEQAALGLPILLLAVVFLVEGSWFIAAATAQPIGKTAK